MVPGDQLRIEIDVLNWKARAVRMEGKVFVEGKMACEALVMCQLVPRKREATPTPATDAAPPAPASAPEAVDEELLQPVNPE